MTEVLLPLRAAREPLPGPQRAGHPVLERVAHRNDWQHVRRLRYEALAQRGDLAEGAPAEWSDAHDAALNAVTFMLRDGDTLLGTTRSSAASARRHWPLPAHEVFAAEMERAFGVDATLVEASLTLVDPAADDPKVALIRLFRVHMLHCAVEDADWLLAAVRESQIGFFRRMFNMEIVSGPERCPGLASPRVLMALAYREQARLLAKRLPVLAVTAEDEREFARQLRG
jgi:hypothetical protein